MIFIWWQIQNEGVGIQTCYEVVVCWMSMSILKPYVLVLNLWNLICFCLVYFNSSYFLFRSLGSRSCCRISTFFQSWFYFSCFSAWIKHGKCWFVCLYAMLTVWSAWQWMLKLWQIYLNHLFVFIKNVVFMFCL